MPQPDAQALEVLLHNTMPNAACTVQAFVAADALGLIVITGIPDLASARGALLPLGAQFAGLPDPVRAFYEHAKSKYSVGWSHGKERLSGAGFDTLKGSYYGNPVHDRDTRDATDAELAARFPSACHLPCMHACRHLQTDTILAASALATVFNLDCSVCLLVHHVLECTSLSCQSSPLECMFSTGQRAPTRFTCCRCRPVHAQCVATGAPAAAGD